MEGAARKTPALPGIAERKDVRNSLDSRFRGNDGGEIGNDGAEIGE